MPITISGSTGIAGVDGSASTPALQGTDTNTGVYFGADTISFSEGGAVVGQFDSSANFQFNSGYGSVATAYGCRAWVNFNGQGTVAIRASGNVQSITDNGAGNYTVNFNTALPDANFTAVMHNKILDQFSRLGLFTIDNRTSGTAQLRTFVASNTNATTLTDLDPTLVDLAIFR